LRASGNPLRIYRSPRTLIHRLRLRQRIKRVQFRVQYVQGQETSPLNEVRFLTQSPFRHSSLVLKARAAHLVRALQNVGPRKVRGMIIILTGRSGAPGKLILQMPSYGVPTKPPLRSSRAIRSLVKTCLLMIIPGTGFSRSRKMTVSQYEQDPRNAEDSS